MSAAACSVMAVRCLQQNYETQLKVLLLFQLYFDVSVGIINSLRSVFHFYTLSIRFVELNRSWDTALHVHVPACLLERCSSRSLRQGGGHKQGPRVPRDSLDLAIEPASLKQKRGTKIT